MMPAEKTPTTTVVARKHEKIPYTEIEPLINLLKNTTGASESEVLQSIGYAGNSASDWRRDGKAPLRAKYGLLGFAAELKVEAAMAARPKAKSIFNIDELTLMFAFLSGLNFVVDDEKRKKLAAKIAQEMSSN
jgi:hypothetical protein